MPSANNFFQFGELGMMNRRDLWTQTTPRALIYATQSRDRVVYLDFLQPRIILMFSGEFGTADFLPH